MEEKRFPKLFSKITRDELPDDNIHELLKDHDTLDEVTRESRKLGEGADAVAYSTSDPNYVLKVRRENVPYNLSSLQENYIYSKQLGKEVPVEQPILVKRPESSDVLIQRRIKTLTDQEKPTEEFYDSLYDPVDDALNPKPDTKYTEEQRKALLKQERARIKQLPDNQAFMGYMKELDNKGIVDGDTHRNNIGVDKNGITRSFDVGKFEFGDHAPGDAFAKNETLGKIRDVFSDKMDKVTKTRILRMMGPMLTGAAGMAYSGLSEASDAEELGNTSEQAALLREGDAQNQMNRINQANVPDDVKMQALELFKKNKLPY